MRIDPHYTPSSTDDQASYSQTVLTVYKQAVDLGYDSSYWRYVNGVPTAWIKQN